MRKEEFEFLLSEAGKLSSECDFVVIGSQAAHAVLDKPPAEVLTSQECDLYPRTWPETASLLNHKLGPHSDFAREHGFYADVVTPEIATLPTGWESRLSPFQVGPVTAYCLELHDLVISKLAAGRLKDLEFAGALLHLRRVQDATLIARIEDLNSEDDRKNIRARLDIVLMNS